MLDSQLIDNLSVRKTRKFPSLTKMNSPHNETDEVICIIVSSSDALWRSQKINTQEREIRKHPELCSCWSCASGNCRNEGKLYKTLKRRKMNWMWKIKPKRERTAITRDTKNTLEASGRRIQSCSSVFNL